MKHIRKFEEASKIPLYKRGEIFIFPSSPIRDRRNLKPETVADIAIKLGYELDEKNDFDGQFLIKTPVGKEDEAGRDFVENYPEFFSGYERRDINSEQMFDLIEEIENDVRYLDEYIGTLSKSISNDLNDAIDEIIEKLNRLKV